MTKTLRMGFKNAAGKDVNILAGPKEGIPKAEASAAQALIIARNLFVSTGGDLVSAVDCLRRFDREIARANEEPRDRLRSIVPIITRAVAPYWRRSRHRVAAVSSRSTTPIVPSSKVAVDAATPDRMYVQKRAKLRH